MSDAANIASDSFRTIRAELRERGIVLAPPLDAIIERVIHSTADFEFAAITKSSAGAVEAGVAALRRGCAVLADVRMVAVGISAQRLGALGGSLHCFVAEQRVREAAIQTGETRSALAVRLAAERSLLDGAIVVIGNAPTALYETIRQIEQGQRPALIIGVPVGFINTAESKAALMRVESVPWIATEGRKGGSGVAVAVVNALLRLAAGADAADVDR